MFGQVARDLVLVVDAVPGPGRSASVRQRREMLAGNGANQAVSLAQLGMRPMLAGVIGEDQVGQRLLAEARSDRVGTSAVIQRPGLRPARTKPGAAWCWTAPPPIPSGGAARLADVLRADARETEMLAGSAVSTAADAEKVAADLLRQGPWVVTRSQRA